jgi:phosphatidylglycerol---prolipoprotein diacylglyceryl transferase
MFPQLFQLPIVFVAALAGGVLGSSSVAEQSKHSKVILYALIGAAVAALIVLLTPLRNVSIPVQGYGLMILIGFLFGVGMAASRARRIGIEPKHCLDISIGGVIVGLAGSRALHVAMYWPLFNPFHDGGFDSGRVVQMFKIWEGGLVFFGTLITIIPFAYLYCKRAGIPAVPFLDLAIPGVCAGQAFGRIGCLLNGCCYGKPVHLPWAIQFPPDSPPYAFQLDAGIIPPDALCTVGIHPTQVYASIASALTAAFLYAYWPRRPYDGFILGIALIMAGCTRFFEELLRMDEPALIEAIPFMTIAHWIAVGLIAVGVALLLFFRRRGTLYTPGIPQSS